MMKVKHNVKRLPDNHMIHRGHEQKLPNAGSSRRPENVFRMWACSAGFSLIELMIAMVVGLVVLGAMYSVFIIQNKTLGNQEEIVAMQQRVRAGMEMMTREIMMAGYNPTGGTPKPGIVAASANSITFTMDITNTDGTGSPDGLTDGPNEYITYDLYDSDGVQALGRKSTSGANRQPVVENISVLDFTYGTGNKTITITITGRTAKPDPDYPGGYRTYTLTSVIAPRNLAF
jgi:type IV pilus assembly protein PilW